MSDSERTGPRLDRLSAPKGTFDTLPPESATFLAVREEITRTLRLAGYGYVETPVFEDTAVFRRGVGESTDVVTKEMYTFTDRGGRSLTLRPELTAGLVRAAIEHNLYAGQLPVKLYSVGANFRYEQPQAGRYRHFTQVDAEALGLDDPTLDAEMVALGVQAFDAVGLGDYTTELNSLGDRTCRPAYREKLRDFLRGLSLDEQTRQRVEVNPLRVLDDKRPGVAAQVAGAPLMVDHLCAGCRAHYDAVRDQLADLGVRWVENPTLVRGLDYYTRTTFEYVHNRLGAQASIGGGGRYDGLSAQLGGPDTSGIGWAIGVDRTLLALAAEGLAPKQPPRVAAFVVPLGDAARRRALPLATELRQAGVATDLAFGGKGLKGAMRSADRSGARYAVILGERDIADGVAQLKDLGSGAQHAVPLGDLVTTLKEKLS
ncbi:MAG TPA: histidine--tRNA ligase [Mycobacteriales bacterium]|nr:histidine--tRNA ligase [Mycobacteriales bacterium]